MTATFSGFYYRVLNCRPQGGAATSQESLPPQIRYMINIQWHMGLWVTTGSVSLNLMEEGVTEQRNIDPQTKVRVCINTPSGFTLWSPKLETPVSVNDPCSTLLSLQVKACCRTNPNSHRRGESGGNCTAVDVLVSSVCSCCFVCQTPLPLSKGLMFVVFAFMTEVTLWHNDQ